MNFKHIFCFAIVALGLSMGMISCSTDDGMSASSDGQSGDAVASANSELTDAQKEDLVSQSLESISTVTDAKRAIISINADNIDDEMPDDSESATSGIDNLKEILKSVLGFADVEKIDITAYVKLCRIYGEYKYDGQKWNIVSLTDKNVLKIEYDKGDSTYNFVVKYGDRIKVTGPDMTKTITILKHNFTINSYVDMPASIDLTVSREYEGNVQSSRLNTNITALDGVAVAAGEKYYFDPKASTVTLTGTLETGKVTDEFSNKIDLKEGKIYSEKVLSAGGKRLNASITATINTDEASYIQTVSSDIKITVPVSFSGSYDIPVIGNVSGNFKGNVIYTASIKDTDDFIKQLIASKKGDGSQEVLDAINNDIDVKLTFNGKLDYTYKTTIKVGPFKKEVSYSDTLPFDDVDIASVEFVYKLQEDGTYKLAPKYNFSNDVFKLAVDEDDNVITTLLELLLGGK